MPLDVDDVKKNGIQILYLGYWEKCDPQENYYLATKVIDFKPSEFRTEQTFSKYNSVDDKLDPFHYYTAYVKYGYGRATEEACKEIRNKYITREEGVRLVHKYDNEFPKRNFEEFLKYINITEEKFYETLDKFRSDLIWKKNNYKSEKYCENWELRNIVS